MLENFEYEHFSRSDFHARGFNSKNDFLEMFLWILIGFNRISFITYTITQNFSYNHISAFFSFWKRFSINRLNFIC